eukprot:7014427-Alexandrium_andersonii.AAC.1
MLLHPAVAEQATVHASCTVKEASAADGSGMEPRGEPAPADGGWDGFPDGPVRRLVPATAAW